MQEWMLSVISGYGYLGIFLLIFIENVFPPIPSEAVLLFAGALTVSSAMNIPGAILAATAGSLAGAIVLYAFGYFFQAERVKKLLEGMLGKILHLSSSQVDRAVSWFSKYQGKAVLICRCIPLVRSLISIPAGFSKMKLPAFLILTAAGSAVWNTVLIFIGAGLGSAWEKALPYFDQYTYVAVILIGLAMIIALLMFYKKRKNKSSVSKT